MLLMAYLPPLWFRVMDERVLRHYGGMLERANLQPGCETGLQARFPQPPLATLAKKS